MDLNIKRDYKNVKKYFRRDWFDRKMCLAGYITLHFLAYALGIITTIIAICLIAYVWAKWSLVG